MQFAAFLLTLIEAVPGWMPGAADLFAGAASGWPQQVALIAVTAVWQGGLIALGLAVLLRLAPRTTAEDRFKVWSAAFATLVGLPLLTLVSKISVAGGAGVSSAGVSAAAGPLPGQPLMSVDARWSLVIAGIWVAATLYRAGDLAVHSLRLRRLWQEATAVEVDGRLSAALAPIAAKWHRGAVEVCTTGALQRPSVIGFFKPRILIPDWLFARLTAGELEQIVLHEAEHLRRKDDWTNLLQKASLVLFPLNLALVWIERRLCREREMACDDGVIRITRAPRAYAACLASLAERGLERRVEALSLGAWERRPELVDRVHSVLRRKNTLGPVGNGALLGALGCSLLFGAIELARCPQMIAFVQVRQEDRTALAVNQTAPLVMQAAESRLGSKRINSPYVPTGSDGAGHASATVHATKIEANLPAMERAGDAREVLFKAELPSAQSAPAQGEWIVVAAFEQVEGSNQNAGLVADYETGASATSSPDSEMAGNEKAGSEQPGQITVTRLILRIVPASSIAHSLSTQPDVVPTRNGWLVLQL
jgi:beta-lactamase regulating signal transducer with metallopeptidase domain